jgi:hypothetical protein
MSKAKNHHYLPEMYLKNFCGSKGKLWAIRATQSEPFETIPKNIGGERDFYAIPSVPDNDAIDAEKFFANHIEDPAAEPYRVLLRGGLLTESQKLDLSIFFGYLAFRHRLAKDQLFECISYLAVSEDKEIKKRIALRPQTLDSAGNVELLSQPSDQELSNRARTITPNNAEFLGLILTNGKLLGERISQMKWQLLIAPNNASFITSDQPVLCAAAEAATCEGADFFALAQAAIVVPVSQNAALRCVPSNEPAQNMLNVTRDFVRKMERRKKSDTMNWWVEG